MEGVLVLLLIVVGVGLYVVGQRSCPPPAWAFRRDSGFSFCGG